MKAQQFKEDAKTLRDNIIAQIRSLLTEKKIREIEFNNSLIYQVIDEGGENEVISHFRLGDGEVTTSFRGDEYDAITTSVWGEEQNHYGLADVTTDQLIWLLEQVETEDYKVFEQDGE